ncbi:MAG: D-alanyl-D-alanine carboxypeptidase [Xanthobacteraceae bacterium]|nr:D-alanyl-D-alanine carboxypeptidase [Xanthobacteraceae bacterium]
MGRTLLLAAALILVGWSRPAAAEALLVVEADSGKVLHAENATYPWYPASVTKLMTAYVVLKAVKDGRASLDTLVSVSPVAAAQAPSKMGFKPGTQLTIDNAMKMMMVKSANDMAVVLAEGLGGSIDGFADEMNRTADRLGMTQTHYVNPNGLPADGHVTSARDLAILARAIIRDLPEYEYFVHIPAIKFGRRVTRNFNSLIGRYPGADGMKTGFICASGFNLVASATRDNKRLIAVVLGAPSSSMRAYKAVQLLERGFSGGGLAWLTPSLGTVDQLAPVAAEPPNLRDDMCGPHRKRQQAPESDDDNAVTAGSENSLSLFAGVQPGQVKPAELLAAPASLAEPVIVYTGPKKTGAALIAANAAEAESQTPKAKGRKGRAARAKPATETATTAATDGATDAAAKPAAAGKPKGDSKGDSKADSAKTRSAKPATTAGAKPDAKSDPKSDAKSDPKSDPKSAPKSGGSQKSAKKDNSGEAKPAAAPKPDGAGKS